MGLIRSGRNYLQSLRGVHSPSASDDVYMCWFQKVEQVLESVTGVILIVGDLNLNPLYTSHHILCYYSYFLTICGMREMNEVTNASGGILDVVLVSERIHGVCVSEIEGGGLVPRRDAYHPPLDITLPIQSLMRSPPLKLIPAMWIRDVTGTLQKVTMCCCINY